VVLVTGGARGITADIAEELAARYRPTLVLVGRLPLPESDEGAVTAGLDAPRELRTALMTELARGGRAPAAAQVEAAYRSLLRYREVRRRLRAMRAAGATVVYRHVDVRDAIAFRDLIDDVYRVHGRLDGVIHGAGLIEDKLLLDKTAESFNRVFDTKATSAFVLARSLRPESLRFLALFSSVAGRFGNRGQADYVAANEVVNKLARELDRAWAGRVMALGWGPWAGGGMVSDGTARQFAARGIELVDPEAGRRAFIAELESADKGTPEVVLGRGPWALTATEALRPAPRPEGPVVSTLARGTAAAGQRLLRRAR
jgi:NAD(P)-dependent dehydrogenase (short-subunit alcohol dehydrogenase family)